MPTSPPHHLPKVQGVPLGGEGRNPDPGNRALVQALAALFQGRACVWRAPTPLPRVGCGTCSVANPLFVNNGGVLLSHRGGREPAEIQGWVCPAGSRVPPTFDTYLPLQG